MEAEMTNPGSCPTP